MKDVIAFFFEMGNETPASESSDAHSYLLQSVHKYQFLQIMDHIRLKKNQPSKHNQHIATRHA